MIILQAQQVGRSFNGNELFANVNLEIQNGARIGLVGPNGIGKTTLLEILTGIAPPDAGQVTTMKNLSIGYLAQNSGLDSDKTIFKEMLTVFAPLQAMAWQIHDLEVKLGDPQLIADKEAFAATMKQYDQLQHDFNEQNGYGYEAKFVPFYMVFSSAKRLMTSRLALYLAVSGLDWRWRSCYSKNTT